ncbi:ULP-PROTEASE domain-containing protein [Fusarium sp. Ph1]|nr:ULP-PROTEASE domain-containing protein [Fusarium sp. Ph1]
MPPASHQPENEHAWSETPFFEPLVRRSCLTLVLDAILQVGDEGEQLDRNLRLAMSQRSAREQRRIRSFVRSLCRNFDSLCSSTPSPSIQQVDVEYRQSHGQPDGSEVRVRGVAFECATRPPSSIHPSHITEHEDNSIALNGRKRLLSIHKQSPFQSTDGRRSLPIHVEKVEERDTLTSEPFCNAIFAPIDMDARIETMPTEKTPFPVDPTRETSPRQTDNIEQGCLRLVDQTIADFVHGSHEQVRLSSFPENSRATYKDLHDSLGSEAEAGAQWSHGSALARLLEAADGERKKATIRYALTAIVWARWHASQEKLAGSSAAPEKPAQEVLTRVTGPKPEDDETSKEGWERHRRRLGTHLKRGRKWSRLVKDLGFGILLKDAWQLIHPPEAPLDTLVRGLLGSPEKMAVLGLLEAQLPLLLETGRTSPGKFRHDLRSASLSSSSPALSTGLVELSTLCEQIRDSTTGDMILVEGTDFFFGVDSIRRLSGRTWLNDEVILACLHLSDKLAFVRVGFSVSISQQMQAHSLMQRPFERVVKQMAKWHRQVGAGTRLVCLFPLFQDQSHFSLLEINEREESIFHYDSMGETENTDIKEICEKEFPRLRYIEKGALRQRDGHSCGPLVIRHAQYRMLGRPVISEGTDKYDARELRAEALWLLSSAWKSGRLVAVPRRKRKAREGEQVSHGRKGKRQKKASGKE